MKYETPVDALKRAIEIAGGQSALASKLPHDRKGRAISQARVWNWVNRGKEAPAENCPDIEALTGVTCEQLRPDVNWDVVRNQAQKINRRRQQRRVLPGRRSDDDKKSNVKVSG